MRKIPIHLGPHIAHLRSIATGNQTPIVFVHGLGVSGTYYVPLATLLAESYDVYIIDLPGYGTTPKPHRPLTILQLSEIVFAIIDRYKLQDTVVVGQSMGCQIAAHTAANHPSSVAKMILLAPTVNNNERTVWQQSYRLLQDMLHEPIAISLLVLRDYIRMGIHRYLATSRYMINDHIEHTLSSCGQPTLIVRGAKDKIVPRQWADRLAAIHTAFTLAELPHAPHLLHDTKPKELASLCRHFIEK